MKKSTILIAGLFAVKGLCAQQDVQLPVEVIHATNFHITKPLSDLFIDESAVEPVVTLIESHDRDNRPAQTFVKTVADGPEYGNDPFYMQTTMGTRASGGISENWLGQTGGGYPPDPIGAVGPSNYVQAVNATPVRIYSKTGTVMGTIANMGSLWSPATGNMGDPTVLYDKYADRWFLAQFGQDASSGANEIYIAISTTNNPAGTYYAYTFTSASFPDYLKFSIWQNGYYMTSNQGGRMYAFERDQMLLGNAASRAVTATYTTGATSGFYCPLPADADGGLPPSSAGLPLFAYSDNAWGGGLIDGIQIWTMTVNWVPATPTATIANTKTGASAIPVAAFDASYDPSWNDVSQPTPSTQKLDGIGGVCTFRAQWRKWTGYNTVLLNWGVKISATQRSIKWVELRQDQTTLAWTLYQQGTYTPDAKSRWVGSMAMDDNGGIALCYGRSSAAAGDYVSLAYTGRLISDPLGTMTFAETTAATGIGTQEGVNRYGDYSCTTLDPSDGLTFWHTGEYMGGPTGGSALRTRVYSFKLPLTSAGVGEIDNTPTVNAYLSNDAINVVANKLPSNDEFVVDLFDVSGKQLSGKKITPSLNAFQTTIDVNGLATGTYLVRIGTPSFQRVVKVFVK